MRQSSGAQKSDKRAFNRARFDLADGSVTAGLLGAVLLATCIWFARGALVSLGTLPLLALVGATVGGALILSALLVGSLASASSSETARSVIDALDAVARGDLTVDPATSEDLGIFGPVARASGAAIAATRSTFLEIRTHATETESRAHEFSLQASAMQAAAQRAAESASLANHGASALGDSLRAAHADASRVYASAIVLTRVQRASAERDGRLRELTHLTAEELRECSEKLESATVGLSETNPDLDALSAASEEIRGFVLLIRKMARQSKLLALNAAMEAARAGEQGSGFAVVASEVRRLARSSQDGADRTESLVKEVLERAARVREAIGAGEGTFRHVAEVARHAAASLGDADRLLVASLAPNAERDDAIAATSPLAEAAAARVEQLAGEAGVLVTSVRESHLASGGQLARTHDLVAAAQILTRVANQVASSTNGLRLDRIAPPAAPPDEPGKAIPFGGLARAS